MTVTKTILITGASSGIGAAAARRLAADGHRLMLGARRVDRLAELTDSIRAAGGTASFRALDVTDAGDVQAFVDAALTEYGTIDVLVNNAGVMPLSALSASKIDEWNWMIDVNIRGVLHGIAAAQPVMHSQGHGHIINIASVGAYEVPPTSAVYSATKFAVRAITEGLRQETGGSLRVTLISPGVTESELAETISDAEAREGMKAYRAAVLPASAIADAIAYAVAQSAEVDVNSIIVRPTASAQ
ncbi:MAG: SDR family oxidoreductase [Rhodococcus sp. (in: high G+C Gram-positive bacteria)]